MKTSNIAFSSNVYVMTDVNKISDKAFMSQVIDPNALNEVVHVLHSNAILSALQKRIIRTAVPCAYAKTVNGIKDYTHGTIMEKRKPVSVNTCENIECPHFSECSSLQDYRRIIRTENITPIDEFTEYRDSDFPFEIDFGEAPVNSKIRKLKVKRLSDTRLRKEFETIIRSSDEKTWGVCGFWRNLADGTVTWVRPHLRHHDDKETIYKTVRYVREIKKYRFKNKEQAERIKRLIINKANKLTPSQVIENALKAKSDTYQLKNISLIDDAAPVVKSPIDSRILVNAGPGTGKTHTAIERLKYIASHMSDSVDPESVLILCFSRSAVKVIRERLEDAMNNGEISYIARNFTISTFDSFATWYILQVDPNYDLSGLSYDARIDKFIAKYNFDRSILNNSISYLIVDEVQDLVGIRARIVQTLLNNLTCGFLLLGDECQAIYDYQITSPDELNAAKLYEWLEEHFKENLIEYEITRNWRNPGKIGDNLKPLRSAMLGMSFQSQKSRLRDIFNRYDISDMDIEEMLQCRNEDSEKTRAILSWSNGDAYRQSQELYTRSDIDISHIILSGSRRVIYRRELADILNDYIRPHISKTTFLKRSIEKGIDVSTANKLWRGILYAVDKEDDDSDVELSDLKRALLLEKRVCEDLTIQEKADVTISTIHKAKGKEYDTVILNQSGNISSGEDIKVYYVALTRAKKDLIIKRKQSHALDIKTENGRYIELSRNQNSKIKRVELGIDGDIDPIGFVDKNLPGMPVEKRQEYIATAIHIGDPIKISKFHGDFLINHCGYIIGRMNSEAFTSFRRYYPSGKYFTYNFDTYTDFDELYVKEIVTIVNKRLDERIDEKYRESGFWYGIEFCGYAKPREE